MALRIWSAFCWLGSLTEANWAVGQLEGTDVAVAVGGGVMDCAGAPGVWARPDEASRRTSKCDAALRMATMILERFLSRCIRSTGRAARSGPPIRAGFARSGARDQSNPTHVDRLP